MNLTLFESCLIVLMISLVVTTVFRRLRLPLVLGYLVVGTLAGPHMLAWLPDVKNIKEIAEFGVVLLMFTVGLEFSLSKIFALKFPVFVLGGGQVCASVVFTTLVGLSVGMSVTHSLIVGCVVAMSSTAIVIKQLSDQLELNTPHGYNAVGILLFQDLAVIPILVLIGNLAHADPNMLVETLLLAFGKGCLAIFTILFLGRSLLRPVFQYIAGTKVIELFTLCVLFVSLGAAWLTDYLGMSYALGAFLAGIMLGETEFRHQIEVEIRPFRDILLSLFFISIGMLVDVHFWQETWLWIALLLIAIVFGKSLLIILLCRLSNFDKVIATRTGLILSQGGEFGFAILSLALTNQLFPADFGQVVLAALLLSFGLSSIVIRYNQLISETLFPRVSKLSQENIQAEVAEQANNLRDHILIFGYGRVGQNLSHFLKRTEHPYLALDLDPTLIQNAKLAGDNVCYGNAAHPDILIATQLSQAKAVVICFPEVNSIVKVISLIQQIHPKLPIIARAKDKKDFDTLCHAGATMVITEIFETSLSMAKQMLELIQVTPKRIHELLNEVRQTNYQTLSHIFSGSLFDESDESSLTHKFLLPIHLTSSAFGVNKTITELKSSIHDVDIIGIRRGPIHHIEPRGNTKLLEDDIIIIYGAQAKLEAFEKRLLEG